MCGIIGIVNPKASEYITQCNAQISHRGPDSNGEFINGNVALGHQRLAIQDLSPNGNQPMHSADGRYTIIFNGEIYNHLDIRHEIADKYPFKSTSDTETVLYGFIEYGVDLWKRLNGIFALAIFDNTTRDLWIVRDHFGIKPLYYYHQNETLLFGSEIKSFSKFPDFDKTIDYKALINYLYFLWSPGSQTPFENVKKLLPGHYLHINTSTPSVFSINKYYEIPFNGIYSKSTEKELIEELDQRLFKAVERQLLSDVPVGFFLSGGLDSSLIVAMAKKIRPNEKLRCYTIDANNGETFEGFANDLQYAHLVAKHLDLDLKVVKAQPDIVQDFDKMIYHLDEPQADAAPLNVLNICTQARKDGYVVLLGGTAGDDLFSGYRRHQAVAYEPYIQMLPKAFVNFLKKTAALAGVRNPTSRRIQKILQSMDKNPTERLADFFCWTPYEIAKNLFTDDIKKSIGNYNPTNILLEALKNIPDEKNALNQLLFWDLKYFLTDHNLNYTDKLSMAVGVEVRVPFLDLELLEFSTTLPLNLKMKGTTTKYLLKKVAERYLPKEVIYRPKTGFAAPVRQWITNDLKNTINQALSKDALKEQNIFNPSTVKQLIEDNDSGKIDSSYTIWSILSIESWLKQFSKESILKKEPNNSII
jgi:asparagine synthase (glutamine-hydrolysing)